MEHLIDVTGADLTELVKSAYDLSKPQGMGFLHYRPEPLTDEQAQSLINNDDPRFPVSLDYVHGRAVKFNVQRIDGKLYIRDSWYDHSPEQLSQLLERVNIAHG